MNPDVALYTRLAENAGLLELVRAGGVTRIYPAGEVPQKPTLPLVTYQLISGTPLETTQDGTKGNRRARVQLDVYGLTVLSIGAVETAIEEALLGRDRQEWDTSDGDHATVMQASAPRDLPPDSDADPAPGQRLHRRSVDYFVFYRKAA